MFQRNKFSNQNRWHSDHKHERTAGPPFRLAHQRNHSCLIVKRRFLLRDTFAGKIFSDLRRPKTISEKLSEFYRPKCRAGVRTRLLFLICDLIHLQIGSRKNRLVRREKGNADSRTRIRRSKSANKRETRMPPAVCRCSSSPQHTMTDFL